MEAAALQRDVLRARQEQREGDRLGVPVGERVVVCLREEQGAPIGRQPRERLVVEQPGRI